jgi:dolichyl-diphosphooligosaccharide--protein glycosyltransferase/undecaprenyl-diphosphooligosaccharide--protein glycosyltransferase
MKEFFNLEESEWDYKKILLVIFLAFTFSVLLRYIWVDQFQNVEAFKWLGQLMINTNDGYYFAEGARDIISGVHQNLDSSPIDNPVSQLTALLVKILPFSFETIILWMPAFLGSLLVVPLVLIGNSLKQPIVGIIAGFLAPITWSYYNRTMTGYYDTDMLTIVLPTFIVWGIVSSLLNKENRFLLIAPIFTILYLFWYQQGSSLSLGLAGMLFLYTVIFERKEIYNYKLLSFMFIALAPVSALIKLPILLIAFGVIYWFENRTHFEDDEVLGKDTVVLKKDKHKRKYNIDKYIFVLFGLSAIFLIASGAFNPIINQIQNYVFRDFGTEVETNQSITLHYFNVVKTVREASAIPWETFVNRISGNQITFWLATIGTALMMFRYRVMLIALPMVALGFLAYKNGLRFTVYAVPIYALGLGYLIVTIFKEVSPRYIKYLLIAGATTLAIYPNYLHIKSYKVPVVFNKNEVAVLDQLKYIAKREDYVVTWWDYGYPIRYYSDVKTLVDGGQHSGSINFFASYVLMRGQVESANMARLAVEYREMNKYQLDKMMEDRNITDPNIFLQNLVDDKVELPEKTRDVYLYLPLRMMNIFPTVGLFSNIDLKTGKQAIKPFFYQTSQFKDNGKFISLGQGIVFDKIRAIIKIGNIERPIDSFYITEYKKDGKLHITRLQSRAGANLSIIFMKNYGKILVVDHNTFKSTYIQLFVFENYSPQFFEPVILTPLAKVYKLKR